MLPRSSSSPCLRVPFTKTYPKLTPSFRSYLNRPNRRLRQPCFYTTSIVRSLTIPHSQHRTYSSPSPPQGEEEEPRQYTFEEVQSLIAHPANGEKRWIIDVREPGELQQTGRIPGAKSIPITSNPDAFALSDDDFLDRFGFSRPRPRTSPPSPESSSSSPTNSSPYTPDMKAREANSGLNPSTSNPTDNSPDGTESHESVDRKDDDGVDEVIFYCKAGVRSKAAARMARDWHGIKIGDMKGGWNEWSGRGGRVERR